MLQGYYQESGYYQLRRGRPFASETKLFTLRILYSARAWWGLATLEQSTPSQHIVLLQLSLYL